MVKYSVFINNVQKDDNCILIKLIGKHIELHSVSITSEI